MERKYDRVQPYGKEENNRHNNEILAKDRRSGRYPVHEQITLKK